MTVEREALGFEARVDERLEQLERHLLGQAALVELQLRTHGDHRTAGIVDALAEQVLTEPALLALEHIGQRLQRTLVRTGDGAATAAVVEQRIHRFLQHALFVADDDVRRTKLDQALQAVVAVDDAAIEIVEIGRGEAAAVQRDERAKLGRNDRNDGHDHPLGLVARDDELLDDLQALGQLLGLQLGGRLGDLDAEVRGDLFEVEREQHVADGFGADLGGEAVGAVLVLRVEVLLFGQQLVRA